AQPLIRPDLHLALDVRGDLTAQVTLDLEVGVDERAQTRDFVVGEVAHARVAWEVGLLADRLRRGSADPVDVRQRDLEPLLTRDVDTGDTSHRTSQRVLLSLGAACGAGWCRSPGRGRAGGSPCTSRTSS